MNRKSLSAVVALLLPVCLIGVGRLAAQPVLQWRTVGSSLHVPWEVVWGPDGWLWFTERTGQINRLNTETQELIRIADIPDVYEGGEAGMLGMDWYSDGGTIRVFVIYASRANDDFRLVRYRYNGTALVDSTPIITGFPLGGIHQGSRVKIVDDKIFITFGDAAAQANAQDHTTLAGKILRINTDGTVPEDNPWADAPWPANLFWSVGHRNPQGLVRVDGVLYSSEHGENSDDEINIIEKGKNYGWPTVAGYCDRPWETQFCADSNVAEPIMAWTPTIAPAALEYYDGDAIYPWKNSLLLTTLKGSDIRQLKLSEDGRSIVEETIWFDGTWGRLRDICFSPTGRVFIATSNRDVAGSPRPGDDRIIEIFLKLPVISAPVLEDTAICEQEVVRIPFTVEGDFAPDNLFYLEISDRTGSFANPMRVDTASGDGREFAFDAPAFIRSGSGTGAGYRFRILSTVPKVVGDTGVVFSITQPPLVTVEPESGRLCGDNDSLLLTATVTPRGGAVASILWSGGDTAAGIIVRDTGSYRVVVTDVNGCSWESPPVTVTRHPLPTVEIEADRLSFCEGDSVILEAWGVGGHTYRWSTGEEGTRIVVKEGGTYRVEAIGAEGCVGRPAEVTVTAVPPPPKPEIAREGLLLTSTAADSYRWYKDGEPIPDATNREYAVTTTGTYRVGAVSPEGCETLSDPVEIEASGVAAAEDEKKGLIIRPQPAKDLLTVEFDAELSGEAAVTVADMRGAVILQRRQALHGARRIELGLEGLPAGAYVMVVETKSRRWEHVFVRE